MAYIVNWVLAERLALRQIKRIPYVIAAAQVLGVAVEGEVISDLLRLHFRSSVLDELERIEPTAVKRATAVALAKLEKDGRL